MPSELLQALYQRRAERANELLAARPELNIFEASAVGDASRVGSLLAEDRSLVDAAADDGFHPLHLAAYFGQPDVVRLLLAEGADPNAVAANASRVRPLHSAISARQPTIMRQLMEAGADPNAQQQGGWTALHSAHHQGNTQAIDLLLQFGANPEIRSDDGRLPAEMRAG